MFTERLQHSGRIVEGKFLAENSPLFQKTLKSLEGKDVDLVIKEKTRKEQRSIQQNRYYWGVVIQRLIDVLGYTKEEMHEILKYKFLTEPVVFSMEVRGQQKDIRLDVPESTQNLNTAEFEDLMSKIRSWASVELAVSIPEPNEVDLNY